jgi:hypothetical protein
MNMHRTCGVVLASALLALAACHHTPAEEADDTVSNTSEPAETGLVLQPEQIAALGIVTTPARAARNSAETQGFAVVEPREPIAHAVTDLQADLAASRQSSAAVARMQQLAGTPGAVSADAVDSASRQASADAAALQLAQQHLRVLLGDAPPWKNPGDNDELRALAQGEYRLMRATFPLTLGDGRIPQIVHVARLDSAQGGKRWPAQSVWRAPADASVPGISLYLVLQNHELVEGERLLAWAATGAAESGVLIPASAAVTSGGQFYCYVEKEPGHYQRVGFDPGRSTNDGYFVTAGFAVGDKIVTGGAAHLLARELNPATEAD